MSCRRCGPSAWFPPPPACFSNGVPLTISLTSMTQWQWISMTRTRLPPIVTCAPRGRCLQRREVGIEATADHVHSGRSARDCPDEITAAWHHDLPSRRHGGIPANERAHITAVAYGMEERIAHLSWTPDIPEPRIRWRASSERAVPSMAGPAILASRTRESRKTVRSRRR